MTNNRRAILIALWICCLGSGASSIATAQSGKLTVDTENAMKRITGKWYDSNSGAYRPPVLSKGIDDSIRKYGWLGSKKIVNPSTTTTPARTWASLGFSGELFGWIAFGSLGTLLLCGLIAIAYHYFGEYVPAFRRKSTLNESIKVDMTKVEDLPFEVNANNDDPLSYAEALMNAGRYNEAVVYLFGYMLLALDQSRKIHLQKGKTNRMYLRELRSELQLQSIVNKTMLAFEDVFFGRYDIDRARFEMLWQQRDEFHRLIRPVDVANVAPTAKVAPV